MYASYIPAAVHILDVLMKRAHITIRALSRYNDFHFLKKRIFSEVGYLVHLRFFLHGNSHVNVSDITSYSILETYTNLKFSIYKNNTNRCTIFMKRHFRTMLHHITRHVSMSIHHLQGYIFTIAFTRSNVAP
jgi:hypothetical protein